MNREEIRNIGEALRRAREATRLSINDFARELAIHPRYVNALETGNYELFSAKIYAEGIMKKILIRLNVADQEDYLLRFSSEWAEKMEKIHTAVVQSKHYRYRFMSLRRMLIWGGGGGLMFLMLLFFATRLFSAIQAPTLEISSPPDNLVTNMPFILTQGKIGQENRLTVNGHEIKISGQGTFEEYIGLQAGLNILSFVVEDHLKKTQTLMRRVVLE